jgi:hypothetical protein
MATSPNIRPLSRSYSGGRFPVTTESVRGVSARFRHGLTPSGHTLEMDFPYSSSQQARELRGHYRSQNGSHRPFELSADAWAGHTSQTDLVPSTMYWRIAGIPNEIHESCGLHNVRVKYVSTIV